MWQPRLRLLLPAALSLALLFSPAASGAPREPVQSGPDLVVGKSHQGDFLAGRSGEYSLTVTNSGDQPTAGQVAVVDLLPDGLTGTSISGAGWNCDLTSLACRRSDPLGSGDAYPEVRLVVQVAARPPESVVNRAAVGGGGETAAAAENNLAQDPTRIRTPLEPRPVRHRFQVRTVTTRSNGSVALRVTVPGAGRLIADDAGLPNLIRRVRLRAPAAGTYTLLLRPGKRLRRHLKRSRRALRVRILVSFRPASGSTVPLNTVRRAPFWLR